MKTRTPSHSAPSHFTWFSASIVLAVALVACSGDDSPAAVGASPTAASSTPAPSTAAASTTTAPTTVEGRLAQAYPDPELDPSPAAWAALLADETLAGQPITVVEFAAIPDPEQRHLYDDFVGAVAANAVAQGGELIGVSDVWRAGLEQPTGYEGGVVWVAAFPSRDAYIATMLSPEVVEGGERRRAAIADPHLLVGVNLVPAALAELPPPGPAEEYPHDLVRGKSAGQVVDELLAIYPDGGADPTREVLEAMLARDDVSTQAVSYVNLYAFSDDDPGAAGITEYNTEALPFVLAHGARPKVVFNVAQQLLGDTTWNRVIYVRWPSLEVFTDLRLTPGYVEAQKVRVSSSDAYGNLITIDRGDIDD